jgi:type IV secretion system protein VirD4
MSNKFKFRTNDPLHHIQNPFGSANFLTENETSNLGLTQQGQKNKFCPYIGFIDTQRALFARQPYFENLRNLTGVINLDNLPEGNGHLLTVAPTRAGKGTGQIIPNLLSWIGSVLVIDIKGENYLRSAGYRQQELNQKVIRFAPFEEISKIWNPILTIRANPEQHESTPEEEEDARYLTNLLITPSGSADGVFWENSAKNFLEGLLLHIRTVSLQQTNQHSDKTDQSKNLSQVRERSMREVRRLLSLEQDQFTDLLDDMAKSQRTLIREAGSNLNRLMGSSGQSKIGQSILATLLEQTSVWAYQRLHRVTYKASDIAEGLEPELNDFSFSQMRNGNTSIYLIIPPDYLTEYRAVLRVMIGCAMRELRLSFVEHKQSLVSQEKPPVLFMLDEFPQLAYMRPIEEALLYLAGYDVRFWFFVQDVSQLQLHYKNSWQSFFANTGTQCFFGVSDIDTAMLVSNMAGMTTTEHTSHTYQAAPNNTNEELYYLSKHDSLFYPMPNYSFDNHIFFLQSSQDRNVYFRSKRYHQSFYLVPNIGMSSTVSNTSRPLITPDEVMRLPEDEQIVFMKGISPILCYRIPYYRIGDLGKTADIKPPCGINFA